MPIPLDIDEVDSPAVAVTEKPPIEVVAIAKPAVIPSLPSPSFPPGCEPREGDPLYLDIETVPDDDSPRAKFFPTEKLPPETPSDKMMPVAEFVALTVEKQSKYADPLNPSQAWISSAIAAELTKEDKKPREGTLKLLYGKRDAFESYIKELSVNPLTLKIVSIGIKIGDCPTRVLTTEPTNDYQGQMFERTREGFMLDEAWRLICDKRYSPIVGFGVRRFDLPAMLLRSALIGVNVPRMIDLRKYGSSDVLDFEMVLFDGMPKKGFGMKTVAQVLGITVPENHGDGSQVYKLYKEGNWTAIATYNRGDCEILRAIHEVVAGKLCQ